MYVVSDVITRQVRLVYMYAVRMLRYHDYLYNGCRGLRVIPVPAGIPDPTRTGGYGSGRVDASRVRVYPLLPVKKVPKSHNY